MQNSPTVDNELQSDKYLELLATFKSYFSLKPDQKFKTDMFVSNIINVSNSKLLLLSQLSFAVISKIFFVDNWLTYDNYLISVPERNF